MIPEPLSGLLWHCAASVNACSLEVATKGSTLAGTLYANSPAQPYLVHEIAIDHNFLIFNQLTKSTQKLSPIGALVNLEQSPGFSGFPSVMAEKEIARLHESFLAETINALAEIDLKLNERAMTGIYSIEDFTLLSCFDWKLLDMLARILNLEFALNNIIQNSMSVPFFTNEIIQQLRSSLGFHNRSIKKEILNALLFHATDREKKLERYGN